MSATARHAAELIRIDTTNWGGGRSQGERVAAEYVAQALDALGLDPLIIESAPTRANVIARVPGREPQLPALVVHGHLDVVPAEAGDWTVDPFAGAVLEGMLWGRGAVDMKDMDAMILTALQELVGSGQGPRRPLIVAFFADEENGGVYGSQFLARERPELFAGASEAISEVGGYSIVVGDRRAYLLQTGEKAYAWIRLVVRGPAAHGSRMVQRNAVLELAQAVSRIGAHRWPVRLTPTTSELLAGLARLSGATGVDDVDALVASTGKAASFLSGSLRNTANATGLTAGYKHNVIPARAEATMDVRIIPGEEEAVLAELAELAGPGVEIVVDNSDIGLEQPTAGPIIDAMAAALRREDPAAEVLPYLLTAGTDNKALASLGIAGYGFVPLLLPPELDFPALFHGVDERVPLAALDFGHRVLTDFLRSY